jgi:hypothetical protein
MKAPFDKKGSSRPSRTRLIVVVSVSCVPRSCESVLVDANASSVKRSALQSVQVGSQSECNCKLENSEHPDVQLDFEDDALMVAVCGHFININSIKLMCLL